MHRKCQKRERSYTNPLALPAAPRYKIGMSTYENPSATLEDLRARIIALRDSL